jgi:hypothetical protein
MHTPPLDGATTETLSDRVIEWEVVQAGVPTREWKVARQDGIETFTRPDGRAYVRARPDEEADVIVHFDRIPGMTPMRLIERGDSATVRRAERKARREARELRKRGYDV